MAESMSHEAPAHEAQALPVMLPPKLVGRDMVLARVYQQLKDNMPVLIHGPAGIGKTALAATLASAYTDLPGGVLWMHLHSNLATLPDMLAQVGRAYDVPEISTSNNPVSMVGAVAATLLQHKPLIVIDGQFDVQTAQDFVTRCADRLPTLLIADDQLVGPWASVALGKLEPEQARLMFMQLAGLDGAADGDDDTTEADIDSLMEVCEFVPFAIAVAAGTVRATRQTPAEFLSGLPKQPGVSGTILTLTAAFRALTSALQGLLLMMGATLDGEASVELLSMVSGAPQEGIQQAMNLLAQRQLVERFTRYDTTFYRLHPLTYAFTQPLLRGSGRLDSLREKYRDSVLTYARTYSSEATDDFDRLAMAMDAFVAIARWAADNGDRDTANQLANALMQAGDFVNARGYVYELLTLRRMAASSTSAFPAHSPQAIPSTTSLPFDDEDESDNDESDGDEAGDFEEVDFEDVDASTEPAPVASPSIPAAPVVLPDLDDEPLPTAAALPFDLRDEDEDEAFEEDDESDEDEDGEGVDEDESDVDEDDDGQPLVIEDEDAAPEPLPEPELPEIQRLRPMLAQARQQGNAHRQSALLVQIGQAQIQAGMENEAIATYAEALAIQELISDPNAMLNILDTLAVLTIRTENAQAGVLHATRGAQLAEDIGDAARKSRFLMLLGDARQHLGESEQAVSAYTLALDAARVARNREAEANLLVKLGFAQLDDNQAQAAITTWEQGLPIVNQLGKRDAEGRILGGLGTAYGELNRWTESIAFHSSALTIAREVGDKDEEALQLSNLGYASVQGQQLGQAVLRYRQALHLAYELNDRDTIVTTIVDLARLLVESPRHLMIADMLIDDAIRLEPTDKDVRRLKERIEEEIKAAKESGMDLPTPPGDARQYAANAYALLEAPPAG